MAAGRFSKQAAPYFTQGHYINNGNGDTVLYGNIATAPAGSTANAFLQNFPGDRIILAPADALAYSNNTVGNLYNGTFRYVGTRNNSTATPTIGRAAFWDPTAAGTGNNISSEAADVLYQVTPDGNAANYTNTLFAGVFINTLVKGNWWWIQECGKATCSFRATITGTPAIGSGVYLINPNPANNNNDNGSFDQLSGANIGAGPIAAANFYATIDGFLATYVGVAETLPANNNTGIVDIQFNRGGFRW